MALLLYYDWPRLVNIISIAMSHYRVTARHAKTRAPAMPNMSDEDASGDGA